MIKNTLFLLFFYFNTLCVGATGILDKVITIEIKSTPVKTILVAIEKAADVVFSYNPALIDENRLVSLSIENKSIEFGLTLIFNKTIRFKEVGNHIILLRNEEVTALKERKKSRLFTIFKGIIKNKETGEPIENASIYEVDSRIADVSNSQGYYELSIPNAETVRSLYIRKKGFEEFVFVADVSGDSVVYTSIYLQPELDSVPKIAQRPIEPIYIPIEERLLSGGLVSYDSYIHTENLPEINEMRAAQISLVPSVSFGSNLSTNGLITNHFSLNILAGYSNGLSGAEVGSILNMDKGDVKWAQVAGICNLVGGDVTGAQVSGILNSVRGNCKGFQASGVTNVLGGNFEGTQLAGIANLTYKNFKGAQVSGISSISVGRMSGLQLSGIFSASRTGFRGAQISGIVSVSDSLSTGLQFSGIHSMSNGRHIGGQISGISNFSNRGVNLIQLAGIANYADINLGLQCAGIFNYARKNKGFQLGLVNISDESTGFTLGLFNFVKKGFHKTEIAINETFPINVTFKSGVRHLYNSYSFGMQPDSIPIFAGGLGLGSNLTSHNKWSLSIDGSAQLIFNNNFKQVEFSSLYKFSTTIDFQVAKWLTVFAGPSINLNVNHFLNDEGGYSSPIGNAGVTIANSAGNQTKSWIGAQFGLRF